MTKSLFFLLALLLTNNSIAKPKHYQQIMMDEPASLLDLTIIQTNWKLQQQILSNKISRDFFVNRDDYEWTEPIKDDYVAIQLPIFDIDGAVDYDFSYGIFVIKLDLKWGWIYAENPTKGKPALKNTLKNFYKVCNSYLQDLSSVSIEPFFHHGYDTANSGQLFSTAKNVFEAYLAPKEDTSYKVTISTENSNLSVQCSKMYDIDEPVKYSSTGDWSKY